MARRKKGELERLADLMLLDAALREGAVSSTKNKHGFGKWMRERGMIHPSWQSDIDEHEKGGFDEEMLDKLSEGGPDRATRERYRKVDR